MTAVSPGTEQGARAAGKSFNVVLLSMFNQYAPQGVNYLHSVLKQAGFGCHIILFKELGGFRDREGALASEAELESLLRKISELRPDLVGVSLASTFFSLSSVVTRRVQREIGVPVVWGGIHPTVAPEECIQVADMVCVGEGEETIVELAEGMYRGKDISSIRGLWVRNGGNIFRNEVRPLIEDLDSIPYPDLTVEERHCLFPSSGRSPLLRPNYLIMSGRGCPFACSYCCNSALRRIFSKRGPYLRRRSVENVIGELRAAKKKLNIKYVNFFDDVFSMDPDWIRTFSERYKSEIGLPFMCYFHPTRTSRELLEPLLEAGLQYVGIGIQSGSERVRRECFDRHTPDADVIEASRVLAGRGRKGLYVQYDLIVDNPFETEDDKTEAFNLLSRLSPPFRLSIFSLCYFPNTPLTERALQQGLISDLDLDSYSEKGARHFIVRFDSPRSDEDSAWLATLFLLDFAVRLPLVRRSRFVLDLLGRNRRRKRLMASLYRVGFRTERAYYGASLLARRLRAKLASLWARRGGGAAGGPLDLFGRIKRRMGLYTLTGREPM